MKIITRGVEELVPAALAMRHVNLTVEGDDPAPVDADLVAVYSAAAREWAEDFLGFIVAPTLVQTDLPNFPIDPLTIELEAARVLSIDSVTYTATDGNPQVVDPSFMLLDRDTNPAAAIIRLAPTRAWPATHVDDTAVQVRYVVGHSPFGADPQVIQAPHRIVVAILQVLAHLYRNRESTTTQSLSLVPMGAVSMLYPLKQRLGIN